MKTLTKEPTIIHTAEKDERIEIVLWNRTKKEINAAVWRIRGEEKEVISEGKRAERGHGVFEGDIKKGDIIYASASGEGIEIEVTPFDEKQIALTVSAYEKYIEKEKLLMLDFEKKGNDSVAECKSGLITLEQEYLKKKGEIELKMKGDEKKLQDRKIISEALLKEWNDKITFYKAIQTKN